jgi:hypothetical protein
MDDKLREQLMSALRSGEYKYGTLLGYPVFPSEAAGEGGYLIPQKMPVHVGKPVGDDPSDKVVRELIALVNAYVEQHNINIYGGDDGFLDFEVVGRCYTAIVHSDGCNLELLPTYIDLSSTQAIHTVDYPLYGAFETMVDIRENKRREHKEGGE